LHSTGRRNRFIEHVCWAIPSSEANTGEVSELHKDNARLKEAVAETVPENRLLKRSMTACDLPEDEA